MPYHLHLRQRPRLFITITVTSTNINFTTSNNINHHININIIKDDKTSSIATNIVFFIFTPSSIDCIFMGFQFYQLNKQQQQWSKHVTVLISLAM